MAASDPVNLPSPPQRMKWRVARMDDVRGVMNAALGRIADEVTVRNRKLWPDGSLSLIPKSTDEGGTASSITGHWARLEEARTVIAGLENFHPGFEEAQ